MRRFWLFLIYGICAVVIESTILSYLPTSTLHFDFILMAVIALALSEDQSGVIPTVVVLGMLLDIASVAPFGLAIFSLLIVYGFIRMIVSKITIEIWLARFVWVGLASLLFSATSGLLMFVWSGKLIFIEVFAKIIGPQALFDAFVGLFMLPALKWYEALTWEKLTRPKGLVLEK